MEKINTVGRRKAAVSRIYLSEGDGKIIVNNRDYKEYFPSEILQNVVLQPFKILQLENKFHLWGKHGHTNRLRRRDAES
jgi:small subunit ribosomal protein S9